MLTRVASLALQRAGYSMLDAAQVAKIIAVAKAGKAIVERTPLAGWEASERSGT